MLVWSRNSNLKNKQTEKTISLKSPESAYNHRQVGASDKFWGRRNESHCARGGVARADEQTPEPGFPPFASGATAAPLAVIVT